MSQSIDEPVRGTIASLFWESDRPRREEECYEAIPMRIEYQCGKCGIAMKRDFDKDGFVRCAKNHLNRRPTM